MVKAAESGTNFLENRAATTLMNRASSAELTLCHVRAATHGAVNTENAHPFSGWRDSGKRVVGVHNGTLNNWEGLKSAQGYDVDSAWAMQMIADHGDDAFQYFDGAYAFVWYDEDDPGFLYACRNDKRPLHFMITENGKTMLGASEAGMLGWLAERNDIKMSAEKGKDGIFFLTPGRIYRFDMKNIGKYTTSESPKLDTRLLPKAPTKYPSTAMYPYSNYYDDEDWGDSGYSFEYGGHKQNSILSDVKKALRDARLGKYDESLEVVDEPKVVTSEDIEEAMHRAIEKHGKEREPSPIASGQVVLSTANSSTATKKQIEDAKASGVFGLVVPFEAVVVDDDDGLGYPEVLGEFTLEVSNTKQTYHGTLPMLPRQKAEAFLRSKEPVPVAIVGVHYPPHGREEEYILAPLSKQQMDHLVAPFADEEGKEIRLVS